MLEDFVTQGFGIEIVSSQQIKHCRLFVEIQDCRRLLRRRDAELLAGIDRPRRFEHVDAEKQIRLTVRNRTGDGGQRRGRSRRDLQR